MLHRFFKMLMNQDGASPGGGAAPPAPATPPAQPAAPPAPAYATVDQVKTVVGDAFKDLRNGLFADLRKSGVFKDPSPESTPPASSTPAAAATKGLSTADVNRIVERERVLTRVATKHDLEDETLAFMSRAMEIENPDDALKWATTYLKAHKLLKDANTQPPATPPAGTPPGAPPAAPPSTTPPSPPISNLGPAHGARDFDQITNPNDLTKGDIERLQQKLGFDAANKKITELSMKWLASRSLRPESDPAAPR